MTNSTTAWVGEREVTIQVLRVDTKKMTLQFFRQIPNVPYFVEAAEPDITLSPWGRVVYPIAKEGHEWLLAERGHNLFRCCIDPPSTSERAINFHAEAIERAKTDLARYDGAPHLRELAKLADERLKSHSVELRAASERLDLSKRRAAALQQLQHLPQLYIA